MSAEFKNRRQSLFRLNEYLTFLKKLWAVNRFLQKTTGATASQITGKACISLAWLALTTINMSIQPCMYTNKKERRR